MENIIDGPYISSLETHDVWVNIYEVDRAYGGPEEGGWYFDTGEVFESKKFSWHGNKERGLAHYEKAIEYASQKAEELKKSDEKVFNPYYRKRFRVDVAFTEGANYPEVAPRYC
jgi:hypothetical protein